jgi:integrase/recombinase XerD
MASPALVVRTLPTIDIYVRHSLSCPASDGRAGGGAEKFKRCKCWKHLRWRENGKLKRKATKCQDWAGAERAKQDLYKKMEANAFGVPVRTESGIAQTGNLYIADKLQQGLKGNTISKNKRTIDRLVEFLEGKGLLSLDAITSEHLIAYRATWNWAKTPEVRKNEQTRVKSFFRWCRANDLMARNPAEKLSTIKGERKPTMPYEPEQMKTIIESCTTECGLTAEKAVRARALCLLMRWSGLSVIDAASLAKTELRFAKGVYRVVRRRLKNGRLVNNKIPTAVATQLLTVPNSNAKYFFWSGEGTERSCAGHLTKDLKKIFTKAKIPDGHPHRFRDTAAVELLKAGVDIRKVSKFLGHASVATTEKYYAPWNKAQQDIMDNEIGSAQDTMEMYL